MRRSRPAIIALADLKSESLLRLRSTSSDWTEQPVFSALFGSTTRGDMCPRSDIDILLVRDDHGDADIFQAGSTGWPQRS
jgi:predicted nucleotidyltransferase